MKRAIGLFLMVLPCVLMLGAIVWAFGALLSLIIFAAVAAFIGSLLLGEKLFYGAGK